MDNKQVIWSEAVNSFIESNSDHLQENDLNTNRIMNDISSFLPEIYHDIFCAKSLKTFGLTIMRTYSYSHYESKNIDWVSNIDPVEFLSVFKKMIVNYNEPRFICYWTIEVLLKCETKNQEDCLKFCKECVCDNYPETMISVISEYDKENPIISDLEEYCNEIFNVIEKIKTIKDFSVPYSRLTVYNLHQLKRNEQLKKDAETKSVFYNIINTRKIKYGVRSSFVQHFDKQNKVSESDFKSIGFKTELPRAFMANPALYNNYLALAFRSEK